MLWLHFSKQHLVDIDRKSLRCRSEGESLICPTYYFWQVSLESEESLFDYESKINQNELSALIIAIRRIGLPVLFPSSLPT